MTSFLNFTFEKKYLRKLVSKNNFENKYFLLAACEPLRKNAESKSGSAGQWYGSENPDP
jgi:hypothetical protein